MEERLIASKGCYESRSMIASMPMYDWPELSDATAKFWTHICDAFREAGFEAPSQLTKQNEGKDHWLRSDLMFSQTCGYPFAVDLLGKVDLLATPVYEVEGCGWGTYRSALVVRNSAAFEDLNDTRGTRLALNGFNSLSGYQCFILKTGDPKNWFLDFVISGSHRQSAKCVASGSADVAAIDAVCWALMQKYEPETAEKLRVLAWTDELPALPYISFRSNSEAQFALKQQALKMGIDRAIECGSAKPLMIKGLSFIGHEQYAELAELQINS